LCTLRAHPASEFIVANVKSGERSITGGDIESHHVAKREIRFSDFKPYTGDQPLTVSADFERGSSPTV